MGHPMWPVESAHICPVYVSKRIAQLAVTAVLRRILCGDFASLRRFFVRCGLAKRRFCVNVFLLKLKGSFHTIMEDGAIDLDSTWHETTSDVSNKTLRTRQNDVSIDVRFHARHAPIQVSWENIKYKVITKSGCKKSDELKILHGLTGAVKPGEMLAILGGSGAGKSTLLDIISGRKGTGVIDGLVAYNGTSISELQTMVRRLTGYVTQEDILMSELTVEESLSFQAELRLSPHEFSPSERKAVVNGVMKQLRMAHRKDTHIGSEDNRGLSGGEKKRVAIGMQLVSQPSVLFLDEPTSGLDSYNSLVVIKLLRELCQEGKTVICTIHQPRSTIYKLFDKLLLLNHGETVFFGPAETAMPYFSGLGYDVPQYVNPADYFIDLLLRPEEEQVASSSLKLSAAVDFSTAYRNSQLAVNVAESLKGAASFGDLHDAEHIAPFATGFFKQFKELLVRHFRGTIRNPMVSVVGIIQSLVMAVIVGSIFYQIGYSQAGIQSRAGALFFVMMFGAFSLMHFARAFVEERLLINRERAAGVYSAFPYFSSRLFIDIPLQILLPVLFTVIFYWMAQLNQNVDRFFTLLGLMIANSLCAGAVFSLIGSLSRNVSMANVLVPGE